MKKLVAAVSVPALALTFILGSIPASASTTLINESNTFDQSTIQPKDSTHIIRISNNTSVDLVGDYFVFEYGSDFVTINSKKAYGKSEGTAKLLAFRNNGSLISTYYITVLK